MRPRFEHRFGWTAVVYVVVVLICWGFALCRGRSDRDYFAVRELKSNHRIVADDLRWPSSLAGKLGFYLRDRAAIDGKYVIKTIPANSPVNAAVVSDRPTMNLPPTMQALVFPLASEARLIGLLDVDSAVVLIGQDPDTKATLSIPATVHAILCEQPKDQKEPACFPVLQVHVNQMASALKNLATLRLALRP